MRTTIRINENLLKRAKKLGLSSVIVLGHKDYDPKFGFERASIWNIKCPFEVPDDAFMAIELKVGSLQNKSGIVEFPKEFQGRGWPIFCH